MRRPARFPVIQTRRRPSERSGLGDGPRKARLGQGGNSGRLTAQGPRRRDGDFVFIQNMNEQTRGFRARANLQLCQYISEVVVDRMA